MVARKYGNSVCYELDRRVVQCILIVEGRLLYFDIGGLSSVFEYRRVVQCVLISEGCPKFVQ